MNTLRLFAPSVFKTFPVDVFDRMLTNSLNESNSVFPYTNIIEEDDKFRIELALPGYSKEQISMNYVKNVLTIKSEIDENSNDEKKFLSREFVVRSFSKQFSLPRNLDTEGISAEFSNGILYVTVPKREEAKLKEPIQVQIQ